MRNFIFLIIALTLLNSCSEGKEIITNEEQQVIQAAFMDPTNSRKTQAAFDILDQRIIKHHKKTDYAIKMQLLLSSEQFNMAMPTINEVLQRYPDYVEMYAAGCALSLQQNDRKMAQDYYQNAIDFYQKQLDDKADKLPIFENMYLLSRLIGDTNGEELYFAQLQQLNLPDEHKSYIEYVKTASQKEMLKIFGISIE